MSEEGIPLVTTYDAETSNGRTWRMKRENERASYPQTFLLSESLTNFIPCFAGFTQALALPNVLFSLVYQL
jgi:hypothetical protein